MSKGKKDNSEDFTPRSFESAGPTYMDSGNLRKESYSRIYETMQRSKAYLDLGFRERCLYIVCKSQLYGKRKPEKDYKDLDAFKGEDKFYLNWHDVQKYGMYKPTMSSRFYKDIQTLIDHGLIERVASGKAHKKKTVYKYSDKWKTWSG